MVVSANWLLLLLRASALLRAFCREPMASSHSLASPVTEAAEIIAAKPMNFFVVRVNEKIGRRVRQREPGPYCAGLGGKSKRVV